MQEVKSITLSPRQAAELAGCGLNSIYNAINAGHLPMRKLGRRSLILRTEFEGWIANLPSAPVKLRANA